MSRKPIVLRRHFTLIQTFKEMSAPISRVIESGDATLRPDKLQYLRNLGITAIEFMPWTAWNNDDFSWG
jgi:1,4-alpha-glucan branching enzyme